MSALGAGHYQLFNPKSNCFE